MQQVTSIEFSALVPQTLFLRETSGGITKCWLFSQANLLLDLAIVLSYFFFIVGESVAFYFGWMTCFTWTLVPIAFVGILLYFFKPRGVTVDDNPLLPLYEILMAFWAISFLAVSQLFTFR